MSCYLYYRSATFSTPQTLCCLLPACVCMQRFVQAGDGDVKAVEIHTVVLALGQRPTEQSQRLHSQWSSGATVKLAFQFSNEHTSQPCNHSRRAAIRPRSVHQSLEQLMILFSVRASSFVGRLAIKFFQSECLY